MERMMSLPVQLRSMVLLIALIACAAAPQAQSQTPAPNAEIAELWQDPVDLATRDLFFGPGGAELAPPATDGKFQFVAFKTSGTNPGYEVKDSSGRQWSVKLGIEAQPEITTSRIMWAMGFAQPPQYFVHQFNLIGSSERVIKNARFRTELAQWKSVGEWSWYDNPFMNAQPFHGLIVAQLIVNNWDLKTINNRIYEITDATASPRRRYMVRDLGASLGWSKQYAVLNMLGTAGGQGSKNDIAGFEEQGFITKVDGNKVTFDYRGMNQKLLDRVTVPDVIWACELLNKISDEQWQAAFKAGAYSQPDADRYIKKIKQKIAQGLALKAATP
jgi:hypothetical protein